MKILKPLIVKIHLLEILILIVAFKAPINPDIIDGF